jgi:hypothetical protein
MEKPNIRSVVIVNNSHVRVELSSLILPFVVGQSLREDGASEISSQSTARPRPRSSSNPISSSSDVQVLIHPI